VLFPYEHSLQQALAQVRESPFFDVMYEKLGPGGPGLDPTGIFALMAEDGYPLTERLKETFFPYRYMALHWRAADPAVPLVGEFNVLNIDDATGRKLYPVDDFAFDDSEKPLLAQLAPFDDISRGGEGLLATQRLFPGVTTPEVWFLDHRHANIRLDLDYRDYLDNLILTKGATRWQYLFADVRLSDREFTRVRESLETMLSIFPDQFPDHDYAALVARFEARL
jgi:hypothetical protein